MYARKERIQVEIDRLKLYSLDEALEIILKTQRAKFTETLDISIKLGIDARKPEQHVKGSCILPKGTGIKKQILAIVSSKDKKDAEEAGADYAGEEFIEKISQGWLGFDLVISSPDMMPKLGKIGKILGTKGLMPNAKYGTIDKDVKATVSSFKNGRVILKNDKYGLLNAPVGKSNFSKSDLAENILALIKDLAALKPATSKGQYLRSMSLSLTMGPSIKLDPVVLYKQVMGKGVSYGKSEKN